MAGEDAAIAAGSRKLRDFDLKTTKKAVKAPSPLAVNFIGHKGGEAAGYGRSVTRVRTTPLDFLGHIWDLHARSKVSSAHSTQTQAVIEEPNNHNYLLRMVKVPPKPLRKRDLLLRFLWKELDDGSFVFITDPCEHEK